VLDWAAEYVVSPSEEGATIGGSTESDAWEEDDVEEIDDYFKGDEEDPDADTDIVDLFEDDE